MNTKKIDPKVLKKINRRILFAQIMFGIACGLVIYGIIESLN